MLYHAQRWNGFVSKCMQITEMPFNGIHCTRSTLPCSSFCLRSSSSCLSLMASSSSPISVFISSLLAVCGISLAILLSMASRYSVSGMAGLLVWVKKCGLRRARRRNDFHWNICSLINLKQGRMFFSSLTDLLYLFTYQCSM